MGKLYLEGVDLELLEAQRKHLNDTIDWFDDEPTSLSYQKLESLRGLANMLDNWSDKRFHKEEERKAALLTLTTNHARTAVQATALYECESCREGLPSDCNGNCVYDQTCSVVCKNCDHSVFFHGNMEDQAMRYLCPYCGETQFNSRLGR